MTLYFTNPDQFWRREDKTSELTTNFNMIASKKLILKCTFSGSQKQIKDQQSLSSRRAWPLKRLSAAATHSKTTRNVDMPG